MIDRRTIITAGLAAITTPISTRTVLAQAPISRITAYVFSFPALAGGDIRLAEYAGRPLLVVNTASLCGFTPQMPDLIFCEMQGAGDRVEKPRQSVVTRNISVTCRAMNGFVRS
jgi:hypothetical protein